MTKPKGEVSKDNKKDYFENHGRGRRRCPDCKTYNTGVNCNKCGKPFPPIKSKSVKKAGKKPVKDAVQVLLDKVELLGGIEGIAHARKMLDDYNKMTEQIDKLGGREGLLDTLTQVEKFRPLFTGQV
jgi:hypothetical protein